MLTKLRLLVQLLILLLVLGTGLSLLAQGVCPSAEDLAALVEVCSASPLDTACNASGEVVPLDQLAESDAPQIIRLSGAGGGDITVTLVNARVIGYEQGEIVGAGVEIGNAAGYNVNLRGGPGSDFDQVGIFRFDERLTADGQSADGAWLRVQLDDGTVAWVAKSLVSRDPALDSLPVVDQTSTGAVGHILDLEVIDPDCLGGEVYVTAEGETAQRVTIDDVLLTITGGTLNYIFDIMDRGYFSISGTSIVTGGDRTELEAGEQMPIGGDDVPPFRDLETLTALGLTPDICLVEAVDEQIDVLDSPNGGVINTLWRGTSYIVVGEDANGFLQLDERYRGGWVNSAAVERLGACDNLPDPNAAPVVSVVGAGLTPDQVMYEYLLARLVADGGRMQALSCASWDSQALLQSQSFRAMRSELLNVACYTAAQNGATATVQCDGQIQTEYNGEYRQWELGEYAMSQENGAWRVCGEAR